MTYDILDRGNYLKEQIEDYTKILKELDNEEYDAFTISGKYYVDPNLNWIFDMDFTSELAVMLRDYFVKKIEAYKEEFEKL